MRLSSRLSLRRVATQGRFASRCAICLVGLGACASGELKEGLGPRDQLPTADANSPYSGTTGTAIAFSSAGSADPEGAWTASWDFGDGATGTGPSPFHSYSAAGTYGATLTVTDQVGQTGNSTATVTIAAAPPPPTPGHPNEPAGYTRFFEFDFSTTLPAGYATVPGIAGKIWKYELSGLPDKILNPIADATAPVSGPDVLRYRYPNGWTAGGASPAGMNWWDDSAAPSTGNQYTEIYESGWIKIQGAGDGTYENQAVGTKLLGYWGAGQIGGNWTPTHLYTMMEGDGATSIHSSFSIWFGQQGVVSNRRMDHNVNPGVTISVGVWHQYELVLRINAIGFANGTLEFWIDGVKWHNYTDVIWRDATNSAAFWGRQMNPVFGGASGNNKSRDDDVYWDHVYMSGR